MEHSFDVLLRELNSETRKQEDTCWEECVPEEIWDRHFKEYKEVACDLDVDKHRWYEVSTTVVKIYDRFLGIRHIAQTYSENTYVDDCYWDLFFFEMEEVKEITYREKNKNDRCNEF